MSPLDADLVRRKLAIIARNLEDLAVIEGLSLESYRADRFRQKGTERLLQELIDAAVDANLHILRELGAPTPSDYFGSFLALGREGVLTPELAQGLAPAAGLRNRLVHEYDRIDDEIVLGAAAGARREFAAYAAAVEAFLGSRS